MYWKIYPKIRFKILFQVQLQCSSSSTGKGLNVTSAAIFIAGEMAGSGVLALPRALVEAGQP